MTQNKNIYYWVLQVLGWSIVAAIFNWAKIFVGDSSLKLYYFYEGLITVFSGILVSSFFRYYLKKNNFIEKQLVKNFSKLFYMFLFCSIVLVTLILVFSHYTLFYMTGIETQWTLVKFFSNYLNLSLILFLWLTLYVSIKSVIISQREKVAKIKLESEIKEAQLNTLRGQINPHFMFNSLNNIRGLMLEDIEKSREMITALSEMLRSSLNMNKVNSISLSEELENVENYVALSKIQFEDRLTFKKQIDSKLLNTEVPPMVLQMLVENSVKHGLSKNKEGGTIILSVSKNNENIIMVVQNPGKIHIEKNSTKVGIRNIKKRLKLLYNDSASFSLSENNGIVEAKITLPIGYL